MLRVSLWNTSMSSISSATCALVAATGSTGSLSAAVPFAGAGSSMGRIITKFVTGSDGLAWLSHTFMRTPERMR